MNTGEYREPSGMTTGDYLRKWLEHVRTTLAPNTYCLYKQIVEWELIPAFDRTELADLSPLQIQAFLARSLGRACKIGGGQLSPQTVLHFYRVLRRGLNQAVRWQLLLRNPCAVVDPPRVAQKEMLALGEVQLKRLLRSTQGSRLHVPIHFAVTTGMRQGALLALRWSDLDLETRECRVARTLHHTSDDTADLETPKTAKSRRVVPSAAAHHHGPPDT